MKVHPVNHTNIEELRQLTNECCIVTDPLLMRGVDYRGKPGVGIDLLIADVFDNRRALYQAQGSVGRYHEPSGRYKLSGLEKLVDEKKQEVLLGKIGNLKPTKNKRTRSR